MFSSEFLVTSLVVVLITGTGVIYTVSSGLFVNKRASIAAAIGCTAGITPHLTASILGISALLHMSAVAFQTIKYIGAIYLLYLSWRMWRESGSLSFENKSQTKKLGEIALKGFLINILNPKLSIFFLAFLPLFIDQNSISPISQLCCMSLIFMAMTFVIFALYGLLASYVSRFIINSKNKTNILQKSFAAILAFLGIKLALAEQ